MCTEILAYFQHADVDIEQLFGNIEEVADVSQRLLTKLEDALNGKDFEQQVLGEFMQSCHGQGRTRVKETLLNFLCFVRNIWK